MLMKFELKSDKFLHNDMIPHRFGCKGKGISPPLRWQGDPKQTKSFALIMQDLDTPLTNLTHWILYNIPSDQTMLSESIPGQETFSNGMIQAKNSMRKNEYMPPCPPFGKHQYVFTLYALDHVLKADPKMNKKKLLKKMNGHILAESELHGFYSKK
mgnify:CR=1 FL=1